MQSLTSLKIFLFLFFGNCLTAQTPKNLKDFNTILPPNCIPINDTLLCDQTEVSNINWKEYTYYIKRIMGEASVEAKSVMSDQDGHMFKLDPDNGSKKGRIPVHKSQYHHHALYDDYPVIGISLQQAKDFCTWRSNVVFEHLLVERNILKANTLSQNRENYFTIDNYLQSEIAQENKHLVSHYPRYFIPSEEEWNLLKEKIQNKEVEIGKINSLSAAKKHQNKNIIPIQSV